MDLEGRNAHGCASTFDVALDSYVAAAKALVEVAGEGGADGADRVELVRWLQEFEQTRNRLAIVDHALIRAAERQDLPAQLGQGSVRQLLAVTLRISKAEAARRVRAAEAVGAHISQLGEALDPVRPHLAAAQQAGTVSPEHVDIISRAIGQVDRPGFDPVDVDRGERLLTEHAVTFGPEELRLLAARVVDAINPDGTLPNDQLNSDRRHLHLRPTRDGAYAGEFRLTGTLGAKLKTLLDPLARIRLPVRGPEGVTTDTDARTHGQRMHDALEDLCDQALRSGATVPESGGIPATVIVTISLDDLLDQLGYGTTSDGTLIPTAKVLELAEQAEIIPAVLNASGAVLELGRTRRIASRSQTLALYARDGGCSFPGCAHPPQYCERHHVVAWIDGGATDLNNLALLCVYHHHHFWARGWTCRINADGLPEWTPPRWVDREQKPLINNRIRAVLTSRRQFRRESPGRGRRARGQLLRI